MGMSTHVTGFKPPDEKWAAMKAIWDACAASDVEPPSAVCRFFGGEPPDDAGVEVDEEGLIEAGALRDWQTDSASGFEVDVRDLPPDVTVLRFANYY